MNSTRITPKNDVTSASTLDVDKALQRGRHLRSQAFGSALKALFRSRSDERTEPRGHFSPDCTAAA